MRYIALLRGINVGGRRKVEMKRLKNLLVSLGYSNVVTYLNSGNALFDSDDDRTHIEKSLTKAVEQEFGFAIPILVKSQEEMQAILAAIPKEWQNNKEQKTDVAYLFPEIDAEKTLMTLPMQREYLDLIYIKGAIVWHVLRENQNKSQLNKLVGHEVYPFMTVRNINTARFLSENDSQ